jgi:iron complex transport system substrate-binding protein
MILFPLKKVGKGNVKSKDMKSIIILFIISIFFISCNQKENTDDKKEIRIISLSPHFTEIIYALEMDSNLVAVTDFCKYPPDARNKENIGGLLNPNIEKIVSLKPTHLFGVFSHANLNLELSKFGLEILMMPNETLDDIQNVITKISDTLNIEDKGKQLTDSINIKLSKLKKGNFDKLKSKAMMVIGREKGSIKNITVAGPNTYLNEIWELLGGQNIFNDLTNKYATVNIEEIIERNPDIIIEFNMNSAEGIKNTAPGKEWYYLNDVKAVKQKKIFEIGGNYSLIPGPRIVNLAVDFNTILTSVNKN